MSSLKKVTLGALSLIMIGGGIWWWQTNSHPVHQIAKTSSQVVQAVQKSQQDHFTDGPAVLQDSRAKFIQAPTTYAGAPQYYNQHTFESVPNQIGNVSGNHQFTFKTTTFLPVTWKHSGDFGNLQALSMPTKQYAYVLLKTSVNYGRIVRFDLPTMQYYQRVMGWRAYRYATYMAMIGKASPLQKTMLRTSIKRGPIFKTGHGQSLTYNPQNRHFYMWQDTQIKSGNDWQFPESGNSSILKIDSQSLRPVKSYQDPVQVAGYTVPGGHVLTNDGQGHWYFYTYGSREDNVKIYQGQIKAGHFSWQLVQKIAQQPGTHVQSMAYNPANRRLYLVADDAIVSFPAKHLGHLRANMMQYSYFSSHREFEGLAFQGATANLLVIRGAEIMQSGL